MCPKCGCRLPYAYASLDIFAELRGLYFGQLFSSVMNWGRKEFWESAGANFLQPVLEESL